MVEMSLPEAQLFRMLVSFFGQERVLWGMSIKSVCGGSYPLVKGGELDVVAWADGDSCLFTVVNDNDEPKMVIEFAPDFSRYIEVDRLDRQRLLPQMLHECGVQYITLTAAELGEMVDPSSSLDLVSFLKAKFGVEDADGDAYEES